MFYGSGWKKLRYGERRRRPRAPIAPGRYQRASAQLQRRATGEVLTGRIFLYDLTPDGVGVFLTAPLPKGEKIFLVLEHPKHLFLSARIVWCGLYRLNTRVLSAENYQYRAGIRFELESDAERELLARYINELQKPDAA